MTDAPNPTSSSRIRFSLRAKLMMAFVVVSLIGFVAAFLVLPRLYVRSQNREIDLSLEKNAQILRLRFKAWLNSQKQVSAQAERLGEILTLYIPGLERQYDFSALQKETRALSPEEVLERLTRGHVEEDLLKKVENDFQLAGGKFEIIRLIPWKVSPLEARISVVSATGGAQYFLPYLIPFKTTGFEGTLVLARHQEEQFPLNVQPQDIDETYEFLRKAGLQSAEALLFFSREELESQDPLREAAKEKWGADFWEISKPEATSNERVVYVPVDSLDRRGQIAGAFCLVYPATEWLVAWEDLASGTGTYVALGIASLAAILFSYFIALGISRPIRALTIGAVDIAQGRLDRRVEVSTSDEIGVLADAFNDMTRRLQSTLAELRSRAETIESQNIELDRRFNQLTTLQNYTENVLATVDSAIFSVDLAREIRRPNRAAHDLLGVRDGQPLEDLSSGDLRERLHTALDSGEITLSEETVVTSMEEERVPVAFSVSPLREGEMITGAVAVVTDLLVIKNLEAQISRQERLAALGQLTAGVAHEIRNPLSTIKACAEILERRFGGQSGEEGLARDIVEEVNRLSRVVTEFLTFARPSLPNRSPVDLNDMLARVLDLLERGGSETITIERDFQDHLPIIQADSDQVEQVLLNLVRNGSEAMKGTGTLAVKTGFTGEDNTVWFEVRDKGEGMDEETKRRMFDPFYTTKANGTGLGLSICHRILEGHGGSIQILDTQPGKGTSIRVSFPAEPSHEQGSAAIRVEALRA